MPRIETGFAKLLGGTRPAQLRKEKEKAMDLV